MPISTELFGSLPSVITRTPTDPFHNLVSTTDTVKIMASIAVQQAHSPIVQAALNDALSTLPYECSTEDIARAIFTWVKSHIGFRQDEELLRLVGLSEDKEVLIDPERLLTMPEPAGDCDDFSTLIACMAIAVGLPTRFVTIAADPKDPERFSHVYVAVDVPRKGLLYLDASDGPYAGWETQQCIRKIEWIISDNGEVRPEEKHCMYGNVAYPQTGGMAQIDWTSVITGAEQIGSKVVDYTLGHKAIYTSGPGGTTIYSMPGQVAPGALPVAGSFGPLLSSLLPWLLIGGIALVVIKAAK
jgi:hypothetical protein